VIPVANLDTASAWYERLLGRAPDNHPMETLAEWRVTDTGWVQVFKDTERAGNALLNFAVDDLPTHVAELSSRGLAAGEVEGVNRQQDYLHRELSRPLLRRCARSSPSRENGCDREESAMPEQFDEVFWDERYRSQSALWSGNPNVHLIAEASDLTPAGALDVGSGEGADAIWLARRGWQVTGLDMSTVALQRGAAHAAQAGTEIAERISWLHADLMTWDPGVARYDLVSAQYMHLPAELRNPLFGRLAAAVTSGGSLLIAGHHPSDLQTTMPRPPRPELYFTGDEIAALLGPNDWDIVTNTAAARSATDPDGNEVTIHDSVLRALRH